jgi:hypothetical protein
MLSTWSSKRGQRTKASLYATDDMLGRPEVLEVTESISSNIASSKEEGRGRKTLGEHETEKCRVSLRAHIACKTRMMRTSAAVLRSEIDEA